MATAAVACSSGDEGGVAETTSVTTQARATTTIAATTTTTTTTARAEPTTPTTETAPPTTTEADLEAQIAADYVRSWELRNELTSNPTLENLDARVAEIAAVGTEEFTALKSFVEELVALGERTAPGDPDIFSVTVEDVLLKGAGGADVTVCYVANRLRVNATGQPTGEFDQLIANRGVDHVVPTADGWLPAGDYRITWSAIGVTECPPA